MRVSEFSRRFDGTMALFVKIVVFILNLLLNTLTSLHFKDDAEGSACNFFNAV
jgi:hypothetical protein